MIFVDPHSGHAIASAVAVDSDDAPPDDADIDFTSFSNFAWHFLQLYSYKGIAP